MNEQNKAGTAGIDIRLETVQSSISTSPEYDVPLYYMCSGKDTRYGGRNILDKDKQIQGVGQERLARWIDIYVAFGSLS
jgi:hypothetical protein